MRYLPHTGEDISAMLKVVGVDSLEELFSTVPGDCRKKEPLNLPAPLTEWELNQHMTSLAATMATMPEYKVFVGAGSYEHFVPSSVLSLLGRSEFVTSYTPYQPEVSQGTLQGIFEYQTLICRLLGMEVANASMYDGASALAEGLLMAARITKKKKVAISRLIHPHYREVVKTYLWPTGYELLELPYLENGKTDLSALDGMTELAAVAIQSPNFFGCIEDLGALHQKASGQGTLSIVSFTEVLAYGLLRNPGSYGADIVCGEGQSLGIPQSFGGPSLGIFASRMKYVRNMPGRLVGKTVDKARRQGFVLTLATREQHIRRERATSNICTNQGLCAMGAAMYMASLGKNGLRELAKLNYDKAGYLKGRLKEAGFKIGFESPTFNEFVVEFPSDFEHTYKRLLDQKMLAGLALAPYYPELTNHYLMGVTETKTKEDIDTLVKGIES
ncbi:MAG: glycine dehydrogenase (aminomethyl-transferring) [Candidatus Altiarchaeales archaeon WOR_SM1_79]|nr:MAG: glycine dehydrogenase (aminomethyl-transferring) [Candidatus Altiarchaeales archaeon WOR_SM1_79]